MNRSVAIAVGVLSTSWLAGCASLMPGPSASAQMMARSGSTVSGEVRFSERGGGLQVEAQLVGLSPGEHGFHLHEVGDCSAADASSAKGHFNPAGKPHGHHASDSHHGGDMPNLVANRQGEARWVGEVKGVSLAAVIGRSVVVHADPDDYKSQPAGNSGKRVACGIIAAN